MYLRSSRRARRGRTSTSVFRLPPRDTSRVARRGELPAIGRKTRSFAAVRAPASPSRTRVALVRPNRAIDRTHSLYWHFSYTCRSCSHFHGRKKDFLRHSLSGMRRCAQKSLYPMSSLASRISSRVAIISLAAPIVCASSMRGRRRANERGEPRGEARTREGEEAEVDGWIGVQMSYYTAAAVAVVTGWRRRTRHGRPFSV